MSNVIFIFVLLLKKELVDKIIKTLIDKSALNTNTLKNLQQCFGETSELSLHTSRGVTDEWLKKLSGKGDNHSSQNFLDADGNHSCSSSGSSFHSAVSTSVFLPMLNIGDENICDASYSSAFSHPIIAVPNNTDSSMSQIRVLDLRNSLKLTDEGLLHLDALPLLETLRLDHCHSITGSGLEAFSYSPLLQTLTLSECRCLTDIAMTKVAHLQNLSTLTLDGCRCLSDISLKYIGKLLNLSKLDLSNVDLLTDEGINYLGSLSNLLELYLGRCRRITAKGLKTLVNQSGRKENLHTLTLSRCQIGDEGVLYLARLEALRHLDLNGCTEIRSIVLGEGLSQLEHIETLDVSYCPGIFSSSWQGKINNLKCLDLCYSGVKDVHLSRVTNLPMLEELNLDSCMVGDWSIRHLADNNVAPNLTSLNLADCDLSDEGMVHLAKFKKLQSLSLFYNNITNVGLSHLSGLTSLLHLNLDSRDISDEGMYHLRNLPLKSLDVFSGRITDIGVVHICKIKTLESLELCGGSIGDLSCSQISHHLCNLTSLNLAQNELITNSGASCLASLSKLKSLNLSHTGVSASVIRNFGGLKELQSLAMYSTRGIHKLKKLKSIQHEMPNLRCLRIDGIPESDGTIANSSDSSDDDDASMSSDGSQIEDSDLSIQSNEDDGGMQLDY